MELAHSDHSLCSKPALACSKIMHDSRSTLLFHLWLPSSKTSETCRNLETAVSMLVHLPMTTTCRKLCNAKCSAGICQTLIHLPCTFCLAGPETVAALACQPPWLPVHAGQHHQRYRAGAAHLRHTSLDTLNQQSLVVLMQEQGTHTSLFGNL